MHDSVRLEVLKSPPSNYIIFRRNIGANSPHKFLRLSFTRLAIATRFEMHAYRPKISPVGQADFRPGKVAIALSRIVPLALATIGKRLTMPFGIPRPSSFANSESAPKVSVAHCCVPISVLNS